MYVVNLSLDTHEFLVFYQSLLVFTQLVFCGVALGFGRRRID